MNYSKVVSARVKPRTKKLLEQHNIPVRSAIERGVDQLLDPVSRLEEEINMVRDDLLECKLEQVALEMELEGLEQKLKKCKLECLHFSEDIGGEHIC